MGIESKNDLRKRFYEQILVYLLLYQCFQSKNEAQVIFIFFLRIDLAIGKCNANFVFFLFCFLKILKIVFEKILFSLFLLSVGIGGKNDLRTRCYKQFLVYLLLYQCFNPIMKLKSFLSFS